MISSSTVWEYYRKITPDQAECVVCSKIIKTGGGTTNVRSHLKSRHKEYFLDEVEGRGVSLAIQPESKLTEVVIGTEDVDQEVYQVEHMPITPLRSRSRERYRRREREILYDRSSPRPRGRELSFLDALTFMIYKDNKPVEMVEEEGFRQFMRIVAPLKEIPSKNTVTDMISAQYEKKKATVVEKLKKLEYLSLSLHICTVCTRTFVAVVTHFISQSGAKPETIILGIRPLTSNPNYEQNIASEIHNILELFDIQESKIISVCSDGSPHVTTAVKLVFGDKKHIQCMTATLKDIIKDGLEDTSNLGLQQLVNDVEMILTDVTLSDSQYEWLIQSISKEDCSTTDKFVLALPHLQQVLGTPTFENVFPNHELIAEINQILTLFEAASREILAHEQLTGSVILPVISCIKSALENINPTHETVELLRDNLLTSLTIRSQNHLSNPLLCRATLCDPRFQKSYLSPFAANQSESVCTNEIKLHLRELRRHSRYSNGEGTTNEDNPLWWKHDKLMAEGGFNSHVEMDASIVSEDEMKLYLGQELLPRNADLFMFWLQSKGCMPGLSHIALKNLTVVSCRIPVEVFLPTLESLLKFEKCSLTDDQLTQRIFLRCNAEN